ncbi:hypothetical protein CAV8706_1521 [Campylobacter avium]|uniref:Cj0814 family flagellar-dependent secreted protein n=1 Tax=Campylobacter avium TaxID=522485 RepID=UPI000B954E34|nr:hypothetical protein [Campylobacter avium]OYD78516.1 hypothetical protein CAV8706_1521 [Campylobacter avium]
MLNAISNNLNSYNTNLDNKNIRNLNLDTTLPLNTTSSQNLVKPKSEAVSEILGYGVDSEGFFTSDFNEAAGLPKDFKIYAEDALAFKKEEELNKADYLLSFYKELDFAKSIGNAYKVFSQLMQDKTSFSNEYLKNFTYAYSVDKNLNITKRYSKDEYISLVDKNSTDGVYLSFSTVEMNPLKFNDINEDSIFNKLMAKLDKNVYKDKEGNISKGGLLTAFMNSNSFYLYAEGKSNIQGKFFGYDENISKKEIKDFANFMQANKLQSISSINEAWDGHFMVDDFSLALYIKSSQTHNLGSDITKLAQSLRDEYKDLVNSNISLDEFKEKYLDFKQRHDAFVALYKEAMNGAKINIDKDSNGNLNIKIQKNLNDEKKPFTPIQAESKSETFTYDDIAKNFFLTFLENERKKGNDVLELLQNLFRVDKGKVDLKA